LHRRDRRGNHTGSDFSAAERCVRCLLSAPVNEGHACSKFSCGEKLYSFPALCWAIAVMWCSLRAWLPPIALPLGGLHAVPCWMVDRSSGRSCSGNEFRTFCGYRNRNSRCEDLSRGSLRDYPLYPVEPSHRDRDIPCRSICPGHRQGDE